jgi:hypothetical protein
MRVIERLRGPSKSYLVYQYMVGDPKVLTKPFGRGFGALTAAVRPRRRCQFTSRSASRDGADLAFGRARS